MKVLIVYDSSGFRGRLPDGWSQHGCFGPRKRMRAISPPATY
jgi:hypothetical protein